MGVKYAEIVAFHPARGLGHAICVFQSPTEPTILNYYDNGEFMHGVRKGQDLGKSLEELCHISAKRQGWKVDYWRRTGFRIGV
jgi:hypothetical protein